MTIGRMWTRLVAVLAATGVVALSFFLATDAVGAAAKRRTSNVTESLQVLKNSLGPLAKEFNDASDRVRFLAILSPT